MHTLMFDTLMFDTLMSRLSTQSSVVCTTEVKRTERLQGLILARRPMGNLFKREDLWNIEQLRDRKGHFCQKNILFCLVVLLGKARGTARIKDKKTETA